MPNPSIYFSVFTYGGVAPQTMFAFAEEARLLDKHNVKYEVRNAHNDALISRARSKVLTDFVTSPHDVCVMVDHDMEWGPGDVLGLATKSHELEATVAGIYACRGIGCGIATRASSPAAFAIGEDKLIEAAYLATGFIAIPRSVVEEVLRVGLATLNTDLQLHHCKYMDGSLLYDFFRPICVPIGESPWREYLSEDYAFSWRCKQAMPLSKLYAWTKPYLRHHGAHAFTVDQAYVPRDASDLVKVSGNTQRMRE